MSPITCRFIFRREIASNVPMTAAAPPISIFISAIPADGFIEIPPVSKVTPLPTRAIVPFFLYCLPYSSVINFGSFSLPLLTPITPPIPSLAIFGFLISVPLLGGIGKVPAIVALTLYALLPIIRNTYIGINNVDPAIREAGKGMGMTDWQLLSQVEFPLAAGVILAGVRVATVISVGVATIGAAIGGGGLGVFIFRGISSVNNELILAGAIPAAGSWKFAASRSAGAKRAGSALVE